jgi:hypothetical protein
MVKMDFLKNQESEEGEEDQKGCVPYDGMMK